MHRSLLGVLVLAMQLAIPPAHAETTTARELLFRLSLQAEAGSSTYDRTYFRHWIDANGDCQNTRTEVLIAESTVAPTLSSSGCSVTKGRWYSWYDGKVWTAPTDVDIDHLVALKEAWESGARLWSAANRQRFANDLGHSWALEAVTDNVNQSKSDHDPATWLPPLTSMHCRYAIRWTVIKYRWRLAVNSTERSRLASILSGTCGSRTVTVPARAI